jgi:quercetin dioxygenase-like cupin family protein
MSTVRRLQSMREPRVVPPGGGELVGNKPERRVEILCEHDNVHATWTRYGPGQAGASPHIHRTHHDVFYVLEGELTLLLADGDSRVAPAGSLVCVPPMVVHGFRNDGVGALSYLNFHTPGTGFADYMRGLGRGERVAFDQEEPPASGLADASSIVVGPPPVSVGGLSITETAEPCTEHVFMYVLDGELAVLWGESEIAAPAGSFVDLPPFVPHSVGPHEEGTRFLCVSAA